MQSLFVALEKKKYSLTYRLFIVTQIIVPVGEKAAQCNRQLSVTGFLSWKPA
jgi:hypothetical protein